MTRALEELSSFDSYVPNASHSVALPLLSAEVQWELSLVWQYLKWPQGGCVAHKGLYSSWCRLFLFFVNPSLYLPLPAFLYFSLFSALLLLPFFSLLSLFMGLSFVYFLSFRSSALNLKFNNIHQKFTQLSIEFLSLHG